jgi:cold-inducible RNA-binding protein
MNSPRLFVGNLPFDTSEEHLHSMFGQCGEVVEVTILKDRDTGRSRGFGFVTMGNENEAKSAVEQLDGTDLGGRALRVNEAEARRDRNGPPARGGRNRY